MEKRLYLLAELDADSQREFKDFEHIFADHHITGSQTKGIPYHITLSVYPADMEEYLENLLDNIQREFAEIEITYGSLGLFGLRVLFANPGMNIKLVELYDTVKAHSINERDDLSAHTTLLIDTPENILSILPEVSGNFGKINSRITHISLYEFFPERFIKRIPLKQK